MIPTKNLRRWHVAILGAAHADDQLNVDADGGRLEDRERTRLLMVGAGVDVWVGVPDAWREMRVAVGS